MRETAAIVYKQIFLMIQVLTVATVKRKLQLKRLTNLKYISKSHLALKVLKGSSLLKAIHSCAVAPILSTYIQSYWRTIHQERNKLAF
jgi:hypothetical protein